MTGAGEQRPGDAARRALRAARGPGPETGDDGIAPGEHEGPTASGEASGEGPGEVSGEVSGEREERAPRPGDAARLALRAAAAVKEAELRQAEPEDEPDTVRDRPEEAEETEETEEAGTDTSTGAVAAAPPGSRPGDVARAALRAARAEARRAEQAAAAEAAERSPAPAVRRLPSPSTTRAQAPAPASAARGRTARDLTQFLTTAFRMPSDAAEPETSEPQPAPAPTPDSAPAPAPEAGTDRQEPDPPAPATPHLPRTMATPHRDTELRRTFPSLSSRASAAASGFAETWWGNAWVRALEEGALDVKRLARGRGYAEHGHVDAITVTPGLVLAYVQGSRPRPYRVQVRLRTFGEDEWERLLTAAADRPADIAALLDKELPQTLADSGVALLPGPGELEPRCSCPDFGHPCKHAAALCYQTARLLDADPFVLLLLRGRGEREVLDALSRRNAARAARERRPTALPGVRAGEALLPRQLPPLPPPLPVPAHPGQPPVYPGVPGGPDPFALDQLATDAAARAHALLATGHDPVGDLTLWQDAVRLAAARPGSGLTASTRALYATLADAVGRTPGDLARAVAAWRQGGMEGLAVLEEPWDPPAGRFDRARPLLLAADLPAFRPSRNHLTHPGGHLQLRFGRDGLWYAYESEPGHDDWWPRGTPDLDPVGALTGLGASDDL
ncbi:SWIM zinc finger family protein [Streptomyces sp. NPDC048291]|uniref:SWIM zinc finger family protein n=1 Tax=Streptomyces sp. NPDC048291 TaxID=3365530 RepID=UPI00371DF14D